MGIKFHCRACGKKLNVKSFLAGRRGICPHCQAKIEIPAHSDTARAADESSPPTGAADADPTAGRADAQPVEEFDLIAAIGTADADSTSPSTDGPPLGLSGPAEQPARNIAPGPPSADADVDPIDAVPDAKWFVRPASGGQYGPAPGEVMKDWIHQGRVAAESLVWREGWAEWKPACEVLSGLAPRPAAATPPAEPAVTAATSAGQPIQRPPADPVVADVVVPIQAAQPIRRAAAPRRRSNASNVIIVVLLLLAVLVLLPVLVYVLMKQSAGRQDEDVTAWLAGYRNVVQAAPPGPFRRAAGEDSPVAEVA